MRAVVHTNYGEPEEVLELRDAMCIGGGMRAAAIFRKIAWRYGSSTDPSGQIRRRPIRYG